MVRLRNFIFCLGVFFLTIQIGWATPESGKQRWYLLCCYCGECAMESRCLPGSGECYTQTLDPCEVWCGDSGSVDPCAPCG